MFASSPTTRCAIFVAYDRTSSALRPTVLPDPEPPEPVLLDPEPPAPVLPDPVLPVLGGFDASAGAQLPSYAIVPPLYVHVSSP